MFSTLPDRLSLLSPTESKLVPDLLASFDPSAVLTVTFNTSSSAATIGSPLTIADVTSEPSITVTPSSNATVFTADQAFTVAMVDPATVGADQSGGQVGP